MEPGLPAVFEVSISSRIALRLVVRRILGLTNRDGELDGVDNLNFQSAAGELLDGLPPEKTTRAAVDGIAALMQEAVRCGPKTAFDEWVWARLLGDTRCRLTKAVADLQLSEDERSQLGKRVNELRGVLNESLPFLETSDGHGAARVFKRAETLLRSRP